MWGASGTQRSASGARCGPLPADEPRTHLVGIRYARGLDHGTYTNVFVSKSGTCGYVEVMLKVTGRDPTDFFLVFFLSPDAILALDLM